MLDLFYFSVANDPTRKSGFDKKTNKEIPWYFTTKAYNSVQDCLKDITINNVPYCVNFLQNSVDIYQYRKPDNFGFIGYIFLDIDSADISITEVKTKIEEKDYSAIILPTKSHNKPKGNKPPCERFRVIVYLSDVLSSNEEYKMYHKMLSHELCNGKDDPQCCDGMRYFDGSGPEAYNQAIIIDGNSAPILTEEFKTKKPTVTKTKVKNSSANFDVNLMIELYSSYLKNKLNLKFVVAHFNESNNTLNLHRDNLDKNPGCFIGLEENIIVDNGARRSDKIYTKVFYSPVQIYNSHVNKNKNLELMAKETQEYNLKQLDPNAKINAILNSEGSGKSSRIFEYTKIMNKERAVLLCKSYDQIYDKKKLFNKFNPDKKVEIILGNEKFLDKYLVDKSEWQYIQDEVTKEWFVALIPTIQFSNIPPENKKVALQELQRYSDIIDGIIKVDLILIAEEKLKKGIEKRGIGADFIDDLLIYDEFNSDHWFKFRNAEEREIFDTRLQDYLSVQSTWNENFNVTMLEREDWIEFVRGPIIILSTEEKLITFMEKCFDEITKNIIKKFDYFIAPKVTIHIVSPALTRKKNGNKDLLAMGLRENNYAVWGNGVNSTINNVSVNGRNMHDDINSDTKITIILNQPSPQELAPYMKNFDINSNEASTLILFDTLNQYLGRCNGYRSAINFKSIDVILPETYADDILKKLRYICNIKTGYKNENFINPDTSIIDKEIPTTVIDKIIHTLACKYNIGSLKEISELFLRTFVKRTNDFVLKLKNLKEDIIKEYSCMKFFKTSARLYNNELKEVILTLSKFGFKDSLKLYRLKLKTQNINDIVGKIPLFE